MIINVNDQRCTPREWDRVFCSGVALYFPLLLEPRCRTYCGVNMVKFEFHEVDQGGTPREGHMKLRIQSKKHVLCFWRHALRARWSLHFDGDLFQR